MATKPKATTRTVKGVGKNAGRSRQRGPVQESDSKTKGSPPVGSESNRSSRRNMGARVTGKASSRTTISGPATGPSAEGTDALAAKMKATEALAAGMPQNLNKRKEYGKAAYQP